MGGRGPLSGPLCAYVALTTLGGEGQSSIGVSAVGT